MAPTEVLKRDPCPVDLQEILRTGSYVLWSRLLEGGLSMDRTGPQPVGLPRL